MVLTIICGIFILFLSPLINTVQGQDTTPYTLDFDCRRKGVTCENAVACDLDTKGCNCPDGNFNYLCQDAATSCDQDHYGTDCGMERVQIDCQVDKMFVNIHPHGTFEGIVYVYGRDNTSDCVLSIGTGGDDLGDYVTNKDQLVGSRIEIQHTDAICGDAVQTTDEATGVTTFVREFFIQYNDQFKSSVDQKVTAECIVSQEGASSVSSEVETVSDENNFNDVNVEGDVESVQFELQTKDGTALPSQVNLGDEIRLVFSLAQGSGFTDFRIESCTANNTLTGDDSRSINFLTNSCPSPDGTALFYGTPTKTVGPPIQVTLRITAFMFRGASAKVAFMCDVKLCGTDSNDNCNMTECSTVTSSNTDNVNTDTESENTGGDTGNTGGNNTANGDTGSDTGNTGGNNTGNGVPGSDTGNTGGNDTGNGVPGSDTGNTSGNNTGNGVPGSDTGNTGGNNTGNGVPDSDTSNTGGNSTGNEVPGSDTSNTGGNSTGNEVPGSDTSNTGGNSTGNEVPGSDTSNTGGNSTGNGVPGSDTSNTGGEGETGNGGGSRKRRKRDVSTVEQVSTQINVVDPNDLTTIETRIGKEEVDCILEPEILALIITLGAAVGILTLITIICGYQLKSRQWKEPPPRPEMTRKPFETFSIPRLELTPASHTNYPPTV